MEKVYHYFYKVENLVNGKIYYGIHSTENINDDYLGSGKALKRAIKKYGKVCFKKTILRFFNTRQEALECEAKVVDNTIVQDRRYYNLTEGGYGPQDELKKFWDSKEGAEQKKIYKKTFGGYNNPSFKHCWLNKYEEIADLFCHLVCNTNLPDHFILKQLPYSFKFHRVLKYMEYINRLKVVNHSIYRDYFTSNQRLNITKKTEAINGKNEFIIYQVVNEKFLDWMPITFSILKDNTVSDSMLYNRELSEVPESRIIWFSVIPYYKYLGLIEEIGKIKINTRHRKPLSTRKLGSKTVYKINRDFRQTTKLIKDNINEEYELYFNGKTFSYTRV